MHGNTDLLPTNPGGWATCINNRGEIGGYAFGGSGPIQSGFRRSTDGVFTQLDPVPPGYMPTPKWINAQGVMIGMSVPGGWASPSGSSVVPLGKLFNMPLATVTDLNDAGWIGGTSEQWDHSERYATLWEPTGGTWVAHDLTDRLNTEGVLLDGVLAINNTGHIIAFGHGDGGPPAYGVFLLTPTTTATNSCLPDIGRHPADVTATGSTSVSAPMSLALADGATSANHVWQIENGPGVWIALGNAPTPLACGGTASVAPANANAVTVTVSPCPGRSSYSIRCVVTNPCGSSTSNAATLSVPQLAAYAAFGSGCAGSLGVPTLQATAGSRPVLGSTFQAQVGSLPNDLGLMALGLSNTMSGAGPLPLELGAVGMPTCQLLVDPVVIDTLLGTAGVAAWTWNVPNNPSLTGLSFYNQAFSFDPLANSLGFAASHGGVGTLGL